MKIRTDNSEFDFSPEDLRHFKLNSAEDLARFIKVITKEKSLGFKTTKKDKV